MDVVHWAMQVDAPAVGRRLRGTIRQPGNLRNSRHASRPFTNTRRAPSIPPDFWPASATTWAGARTSIRMERSSTEPMGHCSSTARAIPSGRRPHPGRVGNLRPERTSKRAMAPPSTSPTWSISSTACGRGKSRTPISKPPIAPPALASSPISRCGWAGNCAGMARRNSSSVTPKPIRC